MSGTSGPRANTSFHASSLNDLIALNDEIVSLARAGVPLERGLAHLASDPTRLSHSAKVLVEHLQRGESLPAALQHDPRTFPPVYLALVEAGLCSGQLAAVLEKMGNSARTLRDVRQTVFLALLYPLGAVLLAFGLFVFFLLFLLPNFALLYDGNPPQIQRSLNSIAASLGIWGYIVPVVIVALFATWWYRSTRAMVLHADSPPGVIGWMPFVRRLIATSQAASLAEILAILLEHQVPLAPAVVLAANTVGDSRTRQTAHSLAATINQGGTPTTEIQHRAGALTPLLRWLIYSGQNERTLVPLLRHAGQIYHRRALRQANFVRFILPAIVTASVGGLFTLLYGLTIFLPYIQLLKDLN